SGLRSISLRYFNVSGAELNGKMGENKKSPSNLMTMAIYAALSKLDSLKVFGNDYDTPDGTGIRDYIHVEDIASGHVGALNYLQEKKKTEIFNLGTGVGYSVLEVIKAVEKASEKSIPLVIEARRSGDLAVSVANPSRANKILDWKAKYSLNDMAKSAWLWHSTHPKGYNGGKEVGR
ncbi:MAG: NAD-dependent epimerase/dehydratase family protein, partial [Candidatus Berkelbacteria bacterium]|nr:NAD-dependent epimerase/dehydratase family protein [Candidatus Berkelbacteria bacterium]